MPDGWVHVARCLGIPYASFPNAMKDLKTSYEKNLLPYDEFRDQVELYAGVSWSVAETHDLVRFRFQDDYLPIAKVQTLVSSTSKAPRNYN